MPEIECVVGTLSSQPRFFCFNAAEKARGASLWTILLLQLLSAPVFAQTQNAAPAQAKEHHRLSGIIVSTKGHSVAIIELPNGHSVMVHEGDAFENGRVVEIADKSMLVRYPQGDRRYWLASSGVIPSNHRLETGEPSPVVATGDSGSALLRTVAKVPVVNRLDALISTGRAHTAGTLNDLLRPLVELPKQVNIVEINHHALGSTQDSIKSIRESLAQGNVVSLGITGDPGKQVMYLMPKSDNPDGSKE